MDTMKTLFIPVALLATILVCSSGCATSHPHSAAWEYQVVRRLDYPGMNGNVYQSLYAVPWKTQLNSYEQQGWSVDSVSFSEEGLASGHPIQVATIVLKRAKKSSEP